MKRRGEPAFAEKTVPPAAAEARAWVDAFLAHLSSERRLSPHTCANYGRDLQALLRLAQSTPLSELTIHQIRRFVAQLHGRGLGGKSLARMLSAWRGFYSFLARKHGFKANPCAGLRAPKSPRTLPHALSPDEMARLLDIKDAAPLALRDRAMFDALPRACGCRNSLPSSRKTWISPTARCASPARARRPGWCPWGGSPRKCSGAGWRFAPG